MHVYVENLKESKNKNKNLLELISEFTRWQDT